MTLTLEQHVLYELERQDGVPSRALAVRVGVPLRTVQDCLSKLIEKKRVRRVKNGENPLYVLVWRNRP